MLLSTRCLVEPIAIAGYRIKQLPGALLPHDGDGRFTTPGRKPFMTFSTDRAMFKEGIFILFSQTSQDFVHSFEGFVHKIVCKCCRACRTP